MKYQSIDNNHPADHVKDGRTQPVFDYKECVFEQVYVETPVDTDGDGKLDLIAVYIRRPKETLKDYKAPAIYVANPYMMRCNEDDYIPHDVDKEVAVFADQNIIKEDIAFDFNTSFTVTPQIPRETVSYAETHFIDDDYKFEAISDVYQYFNCRGYASVFCGGLGTRYSEGFTMSGSRQEILAFKSVIDWLNGRCRAFTNREDNIEIKASWCTGDVAMSGKSYLGTMCIGVAATGVEGLKTIIPEAGIANWYNYYRTGGLNLPALGWQGDDLDILSKYCFSRKKDEDDYAKVKGAYNALLDDLLASEDRESGNYNKFWDERNYLNLISNINASVFIIHGINDWNVKTNQCIPLFKSLEEHNIERKMMLHQGDHINIYNLKGSNTLDIMHQWLDHYLFDIDNGIEKTPKVLVESNLDQEEWQESDTWPPKDLADYKFPIETKNIVTFTDNLSNTAYKREENNLTDWLSELILPVASNNNYSVSYEWDPFCNKYATADKLRISGTTRVKFRAAIDQPTAILSVMLVDMGKDKRLSIEQTITKEKAIVWGKNTDTADETAFKIEEIPSEYKVISRGWLNAQNRNCIWNKESINQGEFYEYSIPMIPTDHILKKGHLLKFIIYGIDAEVTQRPSSITNITIDESTIDVSVPFIT